MQRCLSGDQGVFILCDVRNNSFPIRYASPGFLSLFECSEAECVGKPCWELLGGSAIDADSAALLAAASDAGMPEAEAIRGLDVLTHYATEECTAMLRNPQEKVGFALLISRKKSGAVIVCEQLMLVLDRPELGWSYAIGIQREITHEVPMDELLRAAAGGEFKALAEARLEGVKGRLAHCGIGSAGSSVVKYVHSTAVGNLQTTGQPLPPQSKVATLKSRGLPLPTSKHGRVHHRPSSHLGGRGGGGRHSTRTWGQELGRLGRIEESCTEEIASEPDCVDSWTATSAVKGGMSLATAHAESFGPPGVRTHSEAERQGRPKYVLLGRQQGMEVPAGQQQWRA